MLVVNILLSLIVSLVIMSFVEHLVHRWLMHRQGLPAWAYEFVPYLSDVYHEHAFLHHRKYYRQFNYEPDEQGRYINLYLKLALGVGLAILLMLPVFYFCPLFAVVFVLVVAAHHAVWNIIHEEMHVPSGRWFTKLAIYKGLARYHCMHHSFPGFNFNVVLPFADWCLGRMWVPSERDDEMMDAIGL